MRKVMDYDPATGIAHVFHFDEATNEVTITAEQDASAVIEHNKRQFNDAPTRFGEWAKVASIPLTEAHLLQKLGIFGDARELKKYLNNSDHRAFRTRPGNL